MTTNALTDWPGREIGDARQRAICQMLVRDQGWRYEKRRDHGMLYAPDGVNMHAVHGASQYARAFNHWLAEIKAMGAVLAPVKTVRPRRQAAPVQTFDAVESPWTDSEWRQRQAESDVWWRKLLVAADDDTVEVEAPPAAVMSAYGRELMGKLEQVDAVRPDAQGDGRYTLAHARRMLRDGYSLDETIRRTGWGRMWLADLADRLAAG